MTVTLHLPAAPAARSVMVRRVRALAVDPAEVRSGHGGLVVSDELALAYLADGQAAPAAEPAPARPPTPDVARVVRNAEAVAGLLEPRADAPIPEPPPRTARTTARRPRRPAQQQGAPQ